MGYDIYSLREDRALAEAHARKHRSMWFNEDGSYDEKAPSTLYFRLNIWGMGYLRSFHEEIGFPEVNEKLYDNSGNIIKNYECEELSQAIAALSDARIKDIMTGILLASPYTDDATKTDPEEESTAWLKVIREWQDFLGHCVELKGCEVL
jgi:hypothetical protein